VALFYSGALSFNVDNSPKSDTLTARQLLTASLQEHLHTIQALIVNCLPEIQRAGEMLCNTLSDSKKILICGNGGSAADAQHIAAELVGRYEKQRQSWPAIALTTDTSALTALSNDFGYEEVFSRQVAGLANAGDLLIAISTSGKSANVLRAAEKARELGCHVVGLAGENGEPLASLCDVLVAIPSTRTSRVQEAHITIGHLWCEMVDQMSDML
jgi:D-sedoheptulose 7-phosphate isomerase